MSRRIRFSEKSAKIQKEATVKNYNDDLNGDKIRENQCGCVPCKSSSRFPKKEGKNTNHNKTQLQKGGDKTNYKKFKLYKGGKLRKQKEIKQISLIKSAEDEISRSSIEHKKSSSKNISEHIETIQPGINIIIMSDRTSKETMLSTISINLYGIDQQQLYKNNNLVKGLESIDKDILEPPVSEKEKNGSLEQIKRVFSEETIRIFTRYFFQIIDLIKYILGY